MDEADADKIVTALRERPEGKQYPGNPGVWERVIKFGKANEDRRIEGVFKHQDGRRFVTEGHIAAHHRFASTSFYEPSYANKAEELTVTLPGCKNRWKIKVWDEDDVKAIEESRRGEISRRWDIAEEKWVPGYWFIVNEIWIDIENDVWWYSPIWLAKQLKRDRFEQGILTKSVTAPRTVKAAKGDIRLGTIVIYHEEEVFEVYKIGRRAKQTNAKMTRAPDTENGGAAPTARGNAATGDGDPSIPSANPTSPQADIDDPDEDTKLTPSRKKQRWCYEQYTKKNAQGEFAKKLSMILVLAEKEFGKEKAPKSESDVYRYAERWAKFRKLPFTKRI